MLYESHLVCLFFRHFGRLDEKNGEKSSDIGLLGNMQNPLDALLGDVVGKTLSKYFIIEFKRDIKGFDLELKSKPDRDKLYKHLVKDDTCKSLSKECHYGAFVDAKKFLFQPYLHCFSIYESQSSYDLLTFHDLLSNGHFGVPIDLFKDYIECMYQHLDDGEGKDGQIALGRYDAETKEFTTVISSFEDLISKIYLTLVDADVFSNNNSNTSTSKPII